MPRNGQGIYSPPLGTKAIPNATISSDAYNDYVDDQTEIANEVRSVALGGTGASTPEQAVISLKVPEAIASSTAVVKRAGDRMLGSLSSAVKDHGTLATVTEEFKYADGNTHKFVCNGTVTINPTGLAEGDVMQINVTYTSGSIAVAGTTQWELGSGAKSGNIADVGVVLTVGAAYRIIFEMVGGVRTAVFQ